MNKSNVMGQVGFWAFIVGLVVALIAGIVAPAYSVVAIILLVLGIIVGFLNITAKEITLFLVASIALILVGNAFAVITIGDIGKFIGQILAYISTFVAPAAIIGAIKALWAVGKPGE